MTLIALEIGDTPRSKTSTAIIPEP